MEATFESLGLSAPLLRAVRGEGYENPTPIQVQAIPPALKGLDVLGCAQTGTGKTAGFALPILQTLAERPAPAGKPIRALILSPTRELASQIEESFRAYGRHLPLRSAVIFGGVGQGNQERVLRAGVDILVACPGRLLDLMNQGLCDVSRIEVFVLDEADQMLDMGFIHDVKRVLRALPKKRQSLFFSATMPEEIRTLADEILVDPTVVSVTPVATAAERVDQTVYFSTREDKRRLLEHLLAKPEVTRALVFSRTKHGANRIAEWLNKANIPAEAIHGNKSQNNRERTMARFKSGQLLVLVATDIAARGIDVESVSHVLQFDLPEVPETYVHRIGRTARAGAAGIAWALCSDDDRPLLRDIERTMRRAVPRATDNPVPSPTPAPEPWQPGQPRSPQGSARTPYASEGARRQGQPQHRGGPPRQGHGQPQRHGGPRPQGQGQGSQGGSSGSSSHRPR